MEKQIPIGQAEDLTNQKFGRLTPLYRIENRSKRVCWLCQCDCGNTTKVLAQNLKNGTTLSCGCWNKERDRSYSHGKQLNYTNQVINNFLVIKQDLSTQSKQNVHKRWLVKCLNCGSIFVINQKHLFDQFSCGCIKSKGEFIIRNILNENHIQYKTQYVFPELSNRYFDFAIFNSNKQLLSLIEYDGEQHFNKNSRYYSEEGLKRDREKDSFCIFNNIPLFRIPYTDLDKLTFSSIFDKKYLINKEI